MTEIIKNSSEIILEIISHLNYSHTEGLNITVFKPKIKDCYIFHKDNTIKIYPKTVNEFGGKYDGLIHPSYDKFYLDHYKKRTKNKIDNIHVGFDAETNAITFNFIVNDYLTISICLCPVE